jgi:hypothetical protein
MTMQYNFVDESTAFGSLETKENIHSYPIHTQQDKYYMYNMITTNDLWQSSTSNNDPNDQSVYFPTSFDFNNLSSNPIEHLTMTNDFDYQPLPDVSSSYLVDPYFTHSTSTDYSSSAYISPTNSYQHFHSMYTNTNDAVPSESTFIDTQSDYQSISLSRDSSVIKMHGHNGMCINSQCSTSRHGY